MNQTIARLVRREKGSEKYGGFDAFMAAEFPFKTTVTEDAYSAAREWLAERDHHFYQWSRRVLPFDFSRFVPTPSDKMRDVYFAKKDDALFFKLIWGGL